MKPLLLLCFFCVCFNYTFSQKIDKKLTKEIAAILNGFKGNVGVYVHDLNSNKMVAINADSIFPTASMVKVPILIGTMDKMHKGELSYHQTLTYKDSLLYAGSDILGSFKNNEPIELSKVILLMLSTSDNTASLWLQSLAGGGKRINEIMDSLGMTTTRVNSRTPSREANRTAFGWGQTSPKEMATLLEMIVNHQIISDSASEKMLRLLGRNYWDEQAISQIPADVFVASKNGAVNASRSEVMFVNGKRAKYIFCICTKNNTDESWNTNNEAWVMTKKISALLWQKYK
ncbi:serine hydrolase [Parasediminibacterium paludis]|uniref:beta-lactamase n=1 Tax=Parasediminibacterium paludis TaxID=908966 RepID=A0ABV8PWB2_9BACT